MKLISLVPLNALREAGKTEKKNDDAKGSDENPFPSADDSGKDGEEGAEKDSSTEDEPNAKSSEEAKPLDVVFNAARVSKYNQDTFKGNAGTVTNVSKHGLVVTLPSSQTIFVNFEDIL